MKYEVIVSNIGRVCETEEKASAFYWFGFYRASSEFGMGRGAGEEVTLLFDGDVIDEHTPAGPSERASLEDLLEDVTVSPVREENVRSLGNWYSVEDGEGVFAYVNTERGALRLRLNEINRRLNP